MNVFRKMKIGVKLQIPTFVLIIGLFIIVFLYMGNQRMMERGRVFSGYVPFLLHFKKYYDNFTLINLSWEIDANVVLENTVVKRYCKIYGIFKSMLWLYVKAYYDTGIDKLFLITQFDL